MPTDSPAASQDQSPQSLADALRQEFEEIGGHPGTPKGRPTLDETFGIDQSALCLSGGGIRSGAFALGVIQALARKELLTGIHYLSTVSGGGYTGAWLTALIHRQGGDVKAVQDRLAKVRDEEDIAIRRLRSRTNYLTPGKGVFSTDTVTAVVVCVRNMLLNWLLFIPLLWLGITAAKLLPVIDAGLAHPDVRTVLPRLILLLSAGTTSLVYVAIPDRGWKPKEKTISAVILPPTMLWALALSLTVARETDVPIGPWLPAGVLASWIGTLLGYFLGQCAVGRSPTTTQPYRNFCAWLGAASVTHLALAFVLPGIAHPAPAGLPVFELLGPPFALAMNLAAIALYAGFRGLDDPNDTAKEGLARLSAMKLRLLLLYLAIVGAALALPILVRDYLRDYLSVALGIAPGVIAAITAWSPILKIGTQAAGRRPWQVPLSLLIGLGTAIGLLTIVVLCARLQDNLAALVSATSCQFGSAIQSFSLSCRAPSAPETPVLVPAILGYVPGALAAAVLLVLTSRSINPNRFSLHGFYRNRLIREFLGSAKPAPKTIPHTPLNGPAVPAAQRFRKLADDTDDNLRLHETWAGRGPKCLFPIINSTLNLTQKGRLDWQDRKGGPFTMTPLACGSAILDQQSSNPPAGAYVSAEFYGSDWARQKGQQDQGNPLLQDDDTGHGITLGTAMTVSGAAASPNMGYYTSAATAFLLTLFNLRLGAWLPNPLYGDKACRRSAPAMAVGPYLRELQGRVGCKGKDLYLSDGGHFENLGLYEMVRRKCRFIIVVDGGHDPDRAYADLANAVRKAWIDFQVKIELPVASIRPATEIGRVETTWIIGTVLYPPDAASMSTSTSERTGQILYIKAGLPVDLPADLVGYVAENPRFPNDSTADQWFDETQFESYRHLGFHIARSIGGEGRAFETVPAFFAEVSAQAIARSRATGRPGRAPRRRGQPSP